MRVLLCAVALTTVVASVGASPLLGAKVVHENASPFGTRFNFNTGVTAAAATSAEHVHHQQFRPKRNMQQQQQQHHQQMHLYRPVRQGMPQPNPGQQSSMVMGGGMSGIPSMARPMVASPGPSPGTGKDGLFFQDVSVGGGFGGFAGGFGPGLGLGFGGFGGFPGFGGFGGFGFPGFGGFGGFGFPGIGGGFGFPGPFLG